MRPASGLTLLADQRQEGVAVQPLGQGDAGAQVAQQRLVQRRGLVGGGQSVKALAFAHRQSLRQVGAVQRQRLDPALLDGVQRGHHQEQGITPPTGRAQVLVDEFGTDLRSAEAVALKHLVQQAGPVRGIDQRQHGHRLRWIKQLVTPADRRPAAAGTQLGHPARLGGGMALQQ